MNFIKENFLLIGLAITSGVMLFLPSFKKGASGVPNLSSNEAVTLINRSNALVLDVRDANEFAAGHIAQAKHIALAELPSRLSELKKYKNKPILVHCQRGVRGAKACDILQKGEFTQIHHLQGGLDAWISSQLPVVKSVEKSSSSTKKELASKPKLAQVAANDEVSENTHG